MAVNNDLDDNQVVSKEGDRAWSNNSLSNRILTTGKTFVPNSPFVEQPSLIQLAEYKSLNVNKLQFIPPDLADGSFGISIDELSTLVSFETRNDTQSVRNLNSNRFGGVEGLAYLLRTDIEGGLASKVMEKEEIEQERLIASRGASKQFSVAKDTKKPSKTSKMQRRISKIMTSQDDVIIGLFQEDGKILHPIDYLARANYFGLNMVEAPKVPSVLIMVWGKIKDDAIIKVLLAAAVIIGIVGSLINPSGGWLEAVAIVMAVIIVSTVAAYNDYSKEKKFRKLTMMQTDKKVKVIRNGIKDEISTWELVTGDVVELLVGDEIPADGIYIRGSRAVVDESPLTGETIGVKKSVLSPFMFSGCQLSEGNCTVLITAVGPKSTSGQIQKLLSDRQNEVTPLQSKLGDLAGTIGKFGLAAGILTFLVLTIKWGIKLSSGEFKSSDWKIPALEFVDHFTVAVTVVVVAVPEGLPLSVTMALAFSMFKMIKDQCFVRSLMSSETMGEATCICTDKTGTLTENRMTVVRIVADGDIHNGEGSGDAGEKRFSNTTLSLCVRDILSENISLNSTCFLKEPEYENARPIFVGSATEGALLIFLRKIGVEYEILRKNVLMIEGCQWEFDSSRKRMSTLIVPDFPEPGQDENALSGYRLHVKGASEIILSLCTHHIEKGNITTMSANKERYYQEIIQKWASEGLRTLALAYRTVSKKPVDQEKDDSSLLEKDLILIGIVGIKDPVRKEVPGAVAECQKAGLTIKMVTGDNRLTASKIARECGILTDGIVMEGPEFAKLTDEQRLKIIPNLQVLARSSPSDKYLLVRLLKETGQVVAVTGDGTNDAPALKVADVGFAMGKSGTQIAINASDIVLLDDNFATLVRSIKWGRNVLNCVRKFLQFQLSINFSSVIMTFIGPLVSSQAIFKSAQLLWINLIMDSLGALALATDPPDENILSEPPHPRHANIISGEMFQYIFIQTTFQLAIFMSMLYSLGPIVTSYRDTPPLDLTTHINTMISNTYVLMSVTNQLMSRQLHHEINIFRGLSKNPLFIAIEILIIAIQILILEVATELFGFQKLNWQDWIVCAIIAFLAIPFIIFVRILIYGVRKIHFSQKKRNKVIDPEVTSNIKSAKSLIANNTSTLPRTKPSSTKAW
ncbi:Calcium-transporting ATPase 10, plasma membrane-type [Nowakowskiella sp. JEL0078]|nr:Calcium-transporting ATPase 10, plasma membrane-type [Nowakowskiella sp. JEL0078]